MDNYRAWFKAKTDTFKANYCRTVDNYFDLVLSQIEAITSRTGDESLQELSEMIRHMEDTSTLYQQQLTWLSKRYFDGKSTFDVISSAINDTASFTNPITLSHPRFRLSTRDSYQANALAEHSTNQPQQIDDATVGMPKYSNGGFLRLDSPLSDHQFVSLLPSNHNLGYQSMLPSPSVTRKASVEQQQKSASMDKSGHQNDTDTVSFVNGNHLAFPCVSGCECHPENVEVPVKEEPFEGDTSTRSRKRAIRLTGKLSPTKRVALEPIVVDAEEEGEEVAIETESVRLSVIVHHLKCPEADCTEEFKDKAQLNGHLLSKHQIKEFRCKVKDCVISFASKGELSDHLKWVHRNEKNWPCAQCETACKSYTVLSTHFWDYHEEGEFHCSADKCDFTGKNRRQVYHHQRNHSSVKYECTFAHCAASFKQKYNLTVHLRMHTQEKPFACEECQKAFTTKQNLTDHQRIHSGHKPYICKWPGCDYSARQRSPVNTHVRMVHFGLPATKKEQTERRIIDTRDAREFIEKIPTN